MIDFVRYLQMLGVNRKYLNWCMGEVREVEEEDRLDEMLFSGRPEVTVRAMGLVKMMNLNLLIGVE
jgi:hypothetical protein